MSTKTADVQPAALLEMRSHLNSSSRSKLNDCFKENPSIAAPNIPFTTKAKTFTKIVHIYRLKYCYKLRNEKL